MKKLLLIITVLLMVGCSFKNNVYTEISYDELLNKLENKETFVIVFGSETCAACANYKKTMKSVIKDKNVEIFYVDLDKLSKEVYSKMYSKFVIASTPTTIFISEGVENTTYERIVGTAGYDEIVQNLKKHGYIGE